MKTASACSMAVSVWAACDRTGFQDGLLQSGGIDHGEGDVAESAFPLAPVAGDARPVVDKRQPAADQPVEEGRLADIGAADNGDCEWHE
jgi:hypothetical protein